MSPRSLLFSSDQETSRQIGHALQALGLSVEACPEIFAALRTLTGKTFNVLVVDWDEGLEASFLLKTARESRTNQNIFAIVIGKADASAALEQAGADLVLSKPLRSEQVQHSLLTCNAFTSQRRNWLPQSSASAERTSSATPTRSAGVEIRPQPAVVPGWPTPAVTNSKVEVSEAPIHLSFATFEDGLAGESVFTRLFKSRATAGTFLPLALANRRNLILRSAVIGVAFFAVGYVLSQPLSEASSAIARTTHQTWQYVMGGNQRPPEEIQAAAVPPQDAPPDAPEMHERSTRIRVTAVRNSQSEPVRLMAETPESIAQPAALQEPTEAPEQTQAQDPMPRSVSIPDSLGSPFPGVTTAREVAAKVTPALMDALGPVTISGALSEKLLLEKIVPSYPERALRAGLRGPVVLQAWIGKDGRIEELKLIRGPLLLGQAAFDTVRNWRYKPYLLNGEAVEAQTLVTVDFKLP